MRACPICQEPMTSSQRQVCDMSTGHPEYYHLECYTQNFNRVIKVYPKVENNDNICEECGNLVKELRARDRTDDQGRPIVEMVCVKCMTGKTKPSKKATA
jgi:hypothetical protein